MLITLFTLPTEILQNNKNHSIPPPWQCRGGVFYWIMMLYQAGEAPPPLREFGVG